jgi:hypothetical protein
MEDPPKEITAQHTTFKQKTEPESLSENGYLALCCVKLFKKILTYYVYAPVFLKSFPCLKPKYLIFGQALNRRFNQNLAALEP